MTAVFVDASVLLKAVDASDPAQQRQSQAWLTVCWQRRCGRLSIPVLGEFYSRARHRFDTAISAGDARAEVRRYQVWKPWQIDQATIETAWAAESRYGLTFRDALVVAAAQHQGCTTVLSEHLPHGQAIDRLRIVNPFLSGPEALDTPTT
jgi:predicted nucleic acid-binding protein